MHEFIPISILILFQVLSLVHFRLGILHPIPETLRYLTLQKNLQIKNGCNEHWPRLCEDYVSVYAPQFLGTLSW
jgi:hypothetical protein